MLCIAFKSSTSGSSSGISFSTSFEYRYVRRSRSARIFFNSVIVSAIHVMAVNAYKRMFYFSFLRKHFIILRASIRYIIRKINYKQRYYSRMLGLKQNKRPGIAVVICPFLLCFKARLSQPLNAAIMVCARTKH